MKEERELLADVYQAISPPAINEATLSKFNCLPMVGSENKH